MSRYLLNLAYHGKKYLGFQSQVSGPAIQSLIEAALKTLLKEHVSVTPSGRTDSGVHALAQMVHFDVNSGLAEEKLKKKHDILYRLNCILPPDIVVCHLKKVPHTFHAQKNALQKTYRYVILNSGRKNPFLEESVWRIPQPLDVDSVKKAAVHLVGRHDFSAFCAADATVRSKVREVFGITFSAGKMAPLFGFNGEKFINIELTANGFLKQMVRIMVGTLVAVGKGKLSPMQVKKILSSKDRRQACATAPARGLYLRKVWY